MRDIIFRGIPKTEDIPEGLKENMIGEYVYGFLVKEGGSAYIVGNVIDVDSDYIALDYWTEVRPESVGQYSGIDDEAGNKIFDGDHVEGFVPFSESDEDVSGKVVFENGAFCVDGERYWPCLFEVRDLKIGDKNE